MVMPKAQQHREPGHKQAYLDTKQNLSFCLSWNIALLIYGKSP